MCGLQRQAIGAAAVAWERVAAQTRQPTVQAARDRSGVWGTDESVTPCWRADGTWSPVDLKRPGMRGRPAKTVPGPAVRSKGAG
jgi:hypothetical protein